MADNNGLFGAIYNPDVLSCLTNLSNDEVFTPPEIANAMLDTLPQELFKNPDTRFLDPACKSGVFLREIAKRLLTGLETQIPDLQERIDHIFHNQLYGIAITELTSLLARRSVYCSKYPNSEFSVSRFDDAQGNIRFKKINHSWNNGRCVFCGTSKNSKLGNDGRGEGLEAHAYEFIHTYRVEDILNMKFDVIISNPPYQLSDGGSAGGAMPIYQKFVEQAIKLKPRYISMIIPSRWFAGGRGLEDFRKMMLNNAHVKTMVDYPKSRDCFQGVDIAGGVCYFLMDSNYNGECNFTSRTQSDETTRVRTLNEFPVFIRDNVGIDIIHKVLKTTEHTMSEIVQPVSPFGLRSFTRGTENPYPDTVVLVSSAGKSFLSRSEVKKGADLLNKYLVTVGYLNPDRAGVNNASDGKSGVTTKISIYEPGTVVTETYIVVGAFDTFEEAHGCATYIQCKLPRFLLLQTLSSMHITKQNFQYVPMLDFSHDWDDDQVYQYFELTSEETGYIEDRIRPIIIVGEE